MNGIQGRKAQNEKQIPGCLGRMVNLFDLGNSASGNRLLTDKPHNDGTSISRSCSDVASTTSSRFGDVGDKLTISELRRSSSNKTSNMTPMKAHIAQEMSKEVGSRHSPPNVVAKLMGLDTLPHQQNFSATENNLSKAYTRRSLSYSTMSSECWERDHSFLEKKNGNSPQKEMHSDRKIDDFTERKMDLVRQKFIEAKQLATNEKSRQSKEFQDALEVLSSNRDLFLKFLQEPHSLFSQHLHDIQSIPSPPETKRITVLRPSKGIDNGKPVGSWKPGDKINSGYSLSFSNQSFEESTTQPTRIVVLRPSPGINSEELVTAPSSSPRMSQGDELFDEPEDEIHSMGLQRDETRLSSVFSNGYIGDDSSFNRSDNECTVGNLSDLEVMSPNSRHSWDYINRSSSPFSSSSLSRASCSPESSVCREAKKRLSERWAMMASKGNFSEVKNARKSSSTLGEMLALSDTKKIVKSAEEAANREQELRASTSCTERNSSNVEGLADSPKSLLRSISLPVSPMVDGTGLKTGISKELKTATGTQSSLKGKVSSLFFSRSKKSNSEKPGASLSKDESQFARPKASGAPILLLGKGTSNGASQCAAANDRDLGNCFSPISSQPSNKTAPTLIKEGVMSVPKPVIAEYISDNQDQPSPISVLDPPFQEDEKMIPELFAKNRPNCKEVLPKSNLIDKSPPIGSIARTLSLDDSCVSTAMPPYSTSLCTDDEDWPLLVQTLLSEAGLDNDSQLDSVFPKWHSLESPLDLTLRTKYANLVDKELLQEAKRRQRRSNRKLIFDILNATIIEHSPKGTTCAMLVDLVWGQMREWLVSEVRSGFEGDRDGSSQAVEGLVREEVVGKGWRESMRVEVEHLGKEIEDKLVAELVEDAVVHLTSWV